MTTYMLSIEDMVGTGIHCTRRAILVNGEALVHAYFNKELGTYNPNAESKQPFNSTDTEFDTPFSIVHSFREVAEKMVQQYFANGDRSMPEMKYDSSVNSDQQRLFENILGQEYEKAREGSTHPGNSGSPIYVFLHGKAQLAGIASRMPKEILEQVLAAGKKE